MVAPVCMIEYVSLPVSKTPDDVMQPATSKRSNPTQPQLIHLIVLLLSSNFLFCTRLHQLRGDRVLHARSVASGGRAVKLVAREGLGAAHAPAVPWPVGEG